MLYWTNLFRNNLIEVTTVLSRKHKQKSFLLESVNISAAAAEGKAIARHDGKVIFIPFAAPGDVADIKVTKQKKSYAEAEMVKLIEASPMRTQATCSHFGKCGGCKWQHVQYESQLSFKDTQVKDDLQRIAKVDVEEILPILGCNDIFHYRNKLGSFKSKTYWR